MKTFEDQFMDIQIGMVSLAMEYVQGQADKVFIYGIADSLYSFNLFYSIHGHIVHKHQINDFFLDTEQTVDVDLQSQLLKLGVADIKKLKEFCLENERGYPTEIWITYDVKSNSLDAKYNYEARYENDEDLIPRLEFEKWFEEVKAEENK
ncbi:TPA: hypothetical protein TXL52_001245 [Streptococcus suis]|nr:hypothetical protein [Streptococcus suis]